jgi:outer membrane cobalamin receptor
VSGAYSWVDTRVTRTGFDTSASASYVRGERLIRRPTHSASATVAHGFAGGGTLHVVARHVGERSDRDFAVYPVAVVALAAFTTIDASFAIPIGGRGISLTARADNLLGARYEEVVRYRAPGTVAVVGLQYVR